MQVTAATVPRRDPYLRNRKSPRNAFGESGAVRAWPKTSMKSWKAAYFIHRQFL